MVPSPPLSRRLVLLPLLLGATPWLGTGCPRSGELESAPDSAAETTAEAGPSIAYPESHRGDHVDVYHGVEVADPYRWLEDPDSDRSRAWIEAQNTLTRSWIDAVPEHGAVRDRLETLWNFERYGIPRQEGGRYFYTRNDGLQDQSVLYVVDDLEAEPRVLLDPNTLSEDGTVALARYSISEDGRYMAYGLSDGGSDWTTWYVRDVETGEDLEDEIHWIKFSSANWDAEGKGFYYSRYPEPSNPLEQVNLDNALYYHALGTPQSEDRLVYERPEEREWAFYGGVTEDAELLVIHVQKGTEERNRFYYRPLDDPEAEVVRLLDENDAAYLFLGKQEQDLYFRTNLDAPRGRIIAVDLEHPEREAWKEIVPEQEDTLEAATLVGGRLFLTYLHHARSQVRVFDLQGEPHGEVALPGLGSVWGFGGDADEDETFYGFSGFTTPLTTYRYDIASGESTLFRQPEVAFDPDAYTTRQVFYESKDGTRIPMFITHRQDIEPDGDLPTLLYGYGGFNISLSPYFKVSNLVWMEMGGVYAVPNIRGGGEYGEAWHRAGTLENKQNVFDDFIAAGEWLVEEGYTKPERLAIRGGSNGGLLVGACMQQRPDLFGAAIPAVGVMDMLRYHEFTIGHAWASDYGTSEDPEMFEVLRAYSPVHNAEPGTAYPATLITTADHDDRVVPAHSFKFAAAMQHAQAGPDPILIRIETRAGHSRGKPTAMRIDEAADWLSFLVRALRMEPRLPGTTEPPSP